MRTPVHWLLPLTLLTGCLDGRTGGSDPAGKPDAGRGDIAATVKCGDRTCTATTTDARWGAEPCCLQEPTAGGDPCGLKADDPQLSYAGVKIPVSQLLRDAKAEGQPIANTDPVVECLPRNQPGTPDDGCPSESIGGMSADAAIPDGGMAAEPYEVGGCCRDDGMCGYIDPATDFGCVLISQSLVGKALGRDDEPCQ